MLEGTLFDGKSEVDTGGGFAALICYVNNGEVSPVASAVCGPFRSAAIGIREEIERQEKGGKALTPKNKTTPRKSRPTKTKLWRRRIIMNTNRLIKTVGLYAKIKKKKQTGKSYLKMRRLLALSKKRQRADLPAESSSAICAAK